MPTDKDVDVEVARIAGVAQTVSAEITARATVRSAWIGAAAACAVALLASGTTAALVMRVSANASVVNNISVQQAATREQFSKLEFRGDCVARARPDGVEMTLSSSYVKTLSKSGLELAEYDVEQSESLRSLASAASAFLGVAFLSTPPIANSAEVTVVGYADGVDIARNGVPYSAEYDTICDLPDSGTVQLLATLKVIPADQPVLLACARAGSVARAIEVGPFGRVPIDRRAVLSSQSRDGTKRRVDVTIVLHSSVPELSRNPSAFCPSPPPNAASAL